MKSRIPKFKSVGEERRFWDTHDTTAFLDEFTPVKVKFVSRRSPTVSVKLTGLEVRVLQHVLGRITGTSPRLHASVHRR